MPLNPEVQLILLAVGLYLFDSSCLLRADEALLTRSRAGWRALFGLDEFLLGGRAWCLTPLAMPHVPVYRLTWDQTGTRDSRTASDWQVDVPVFRRIAPFTITAGVALFILLPTGLFLYRSTAFLLVVAALIYVDIAIALALLFPHRKRFGKDGVRFAGLAFECLACPPLGVNLVRRVTLAQPVSEDFLAACERLLPAGEAHSARQRCATRLSEALTNEPADSERALAMTAYQARLSEQQDRDE